LLPQIGIREVRSNLLCKALLSTGSRHVYDRLVLWAFHSECNTYKYNRVTNRVQIQSLRHTRKMSSTCSALSSQNKKVIQFYSALTMVRKNVSFLGAFAKSSEKQLTIPSVRMEQFGPHWKFQEI